MQTFLPFASFRRSAEVLDPRRLGKQRVEVLQILRALLFEDYGWQSHPVVCMWRGHGEALIRYGLEVVDVWLQRGFSDSVRPQLLEFLPRSAGPPRTQAELEREGALPPWLGWEALHQPHRSQLIRKDPATYRPIFPSDPDDLPYAWPALPERSREEIAPPTAWVVRATSRQSLACFRSSNFVGLPAIEGSGPKAARQVERFRHAVREGEAVLVPDGAELHVGTVRGAYRYVPRTTFVHRRPIEWHGTIASEVLDLPARLQDPRTFFAITGEEDPRSRGRSSQDVSSPPIGPAASVSKLESVVPKSGARVVHTSFAVWPRPETSSTRPRGASRTPSPPKKRNG